MGKEDKPKKKKDKKEKDKKEKKKKDVDSEEKSVTSDKKKKDKKEKKKKDSDDDVSEAVGDLEISGMSSVEDFEALFEDIKATCEEKINLKEKEKMAFSMICQNYLDPLTSRQKVAEKLRELKREEQTRETKEKIRAQMEKAEDLDRTVATREKWCIKGALRVFSHLKEDLLVEIEPQLVQGAILAQSTPQKFADYVSKGKENKKLLKRLFDDTELMKEMLTHGGVKGCEYGEAARIFDACMEDDESSKKGAKWTKLHRKIALACALELASPLNEFDTSIRVDPVARYKHFVDAHEAGELDPAFPYFSVWEMRHIVNCDAPNDQMSWCRKMLINYAPQFLILTNYRQRYLFMLHADVRTRKPTWDSSPRTYQMVLSGGGNATVNAWFGRFLLKSFGLPTWGAQFEGEENFTFWTPEGWITMNSEDWETCSWEGKAGIDFKTETESRNKATPEEYFKRLVSLRCLADILDGDPNSIPDGEKHQMHPDRMWRSMAAVSMKLLFQTEPEVERTFERSGEGLVQTNSEKYVEKYHADPVDDEVTYDDTTGELVIPAICNTFRDGTAQTSVSFEAGKQLNFVADGNAHYVVPDDFPTNTYMLTLEVCTVSSKQAPLKIRIVDDYEVFDKTYEVEIPYTKGEWQSTAGVSVEIEASCMVKLSRPKESLGLAIKKLLISPK